MNLLITGANGFIGKALTARLLRGAVGGTDQHMLLLDLAMQGEAPAHCSHLSGNFGDPALLERAFSQPVDVIYHLASVPGGTAEQQYELGRRVNLDATVALLEAAAAQARRSFAPTFVFASSIAVIGAPLPDPVTDATPTRPQLTYGAHKLVAEILIEDFHRRGWLTGRSIRLPGIVARPAQRTGQLSLFMSEIIRELSAGRSFTCPVSADSTLWLMSIHRVVDNLLHASRLTEAQCDGRRVWTLPALRCSMTELVQAVGEVYGVDAASQVAYESTPALEANFGRHPPLFTPAAEAAGFCHDGTLATLVRRALEPL
jgi:nucleoside-diphosphate-sugar epimerase